MSRTCSLNFHTNLPAVSRIFKAQMAQGGTGTIYTPKDLSLKIAGIGHWHVDVNPLASCKSWRRRFPFGHIPRTFPLLFTRCRTSLLPPPTCTNFYKAI